jgi:EAL domain-containing protein (putative c-di-GMP-specific phosphodiesterase class I)/GGDEF domain-containing protein
LAKKSKASTTEKHHDYSTNLLMNWVNVRVMSVENDKMRLLLHDSITGLPTVSLVISEIEKTLASHTQVGLIHIELEKTPKLQESLSHDAFEHLMNHIASLLQTFKGHVIRADDTITAVMRNGNEYAIIMSPPRKNQAIAYDDLLTVRNRLLRSLRDKLRSTVDQNVYRKLHLIAGIALIESIPGQLVDLLLAEALESARAHAANRDMDKKEVEIDRLRVALDEGTISVVWQPIVDIKTGKAIGYEALSRGPENIEHPEYLFKLAIEADLAGQLDRFCREQALGQAKNMPPGQMFINLHPLAVVDPDFLEMVERLKKGDYGVDADTIVFDLSENYMTYNPATFQEALGVLQANGLNLCVDDAGSGYYMGLELITHIKPKYVKINGHIIRDIDKDKVKRELAATIHKFAEAAGSDVIAEAVETNEELATLKKLGVKFAQGYLFAKPAAEFPIISS